METKQKIHVWITKYALTQGIFEIDAETCYSIDPGMISEGHQCYFGKGKDWHETFEGAKVRAELMREKQIKNLEKKIEKLKKMKF